MASRRTKFGSKPRPSARVGVARAAGAGLGGGGADEGYLKLSMRPLYVLAFLLPLIVFYEAAAGFHVIGSAGIEETIRARRVLADVFRVFNVGGLYLPGVLVAVVLLVWHVLKKDPWVLRWRVLGLMALECLVWTPPALVLGQVIYKLMSGNMGAHPPAAIMLAAIGAGGGGDATPGAELASRPLLGRAAIAVGAGLYEEMLFRMVAITLIHFIVVDLIGVNNRRGTAASVVLAAAAFALYHDASTAAAAGGAVAAFNWANAGFYMFAGLYFGAVYVWRGFGVVVGVHVLYDLAVLVFLRQ